MLASGGIRRTIHRVSTDPANPVSTSKMKRGWQITVQSWDVIWTRPAMLVLPAISFVLMALTFAVILGPWGYDLAANYLDPRHVAVAMVLCAYPIAFISTFFNVAYCAMADAALQGRQMSLTAALRFALGRLRVIATWTLLTTVVGVSLKLIEQIPAAGGLLARLIEFVADTAWALASFFVVPALVVEDISAVAALRMSVRTIKERWGESVTGAVVIGGAVSLVAIPIVILAMIGAVMLTSGAQLAGGIMLAVAVVGLGMAWTLQTAVSQVFRLALLRYATTGEIYGPFTAADLDGAFKKKTNRFF